MSIFFVNTQDAQISNAFLATLGAAPGSTYLAQVKTFGLVPSVQAMINATGSSTAAALSTKVATNLGLTGSALTGGTAYLSSVTFAGSSSAWAANLMETLNLFSTLQSDATYGSAATAYLARVNSAVSYSSVAANNSTDLSTLAAAVGSAGSTGSGSTFTLTTGVDSGPAFTGGALNDTFDATHLTFGASDALVGGNGTDTLNIVNTGTAAFTAPAALVSGIENIAVRNLSNSPAVAAIAAVNETQTVTVTGTVGGASTTVSFLGVATASVASESVASTVAAAITAAKAGIIAGTQGVALGLIDISNTAAVLNLTFSSTKGDVVNVFSSPSGTGAVISFGVGVETLKGVVGVAEVAATSPITAVTATNFIGATAFTTDTSNSVVNFTGLTAAQTANMNGGSGGMGAGFGATVTAGTVNISGGTTGGAVGITGAALTTATINSTGAPATATGAIGTNTIGALTGAATTTATTINASSGLTTGAATNLGATVTLTGAGNVSFGTNALQAGVTTLNASAMTGGLTVVLGSAVTQVVTGGSGNDVITSGAILTTGSVNAGAGTGDILVVAAANHVDTTVLAAKYTNFETVRSAVSLDMALIAGITGLQVTASDNQTFSNMSAAQAANVTLRGNIVNDVTFAITGAANAGQLDTLALTINDGVVAAATITAADISATGVETVRITATDSFTATVLTGLTSMTNLTVLGAGNVSLTTGALALNVNTVINASAVTGTVTVNAADATGNGAAITGSATKVNTLTGGAGADVIIGGSANDIFTVSRGVDTFTGGGGSNSYLVTNISVNAAFATDRVVITDFIAGTATTSVDTITFDLSNLNLLEDDSSLTANLVNFVEGDGTALTATGGFLTTQTVAADGVALLAATELVLIDIGTYANDAAVVTAFAAGLLTFTTAGGGVVVDNDGILIAYKVTGGGINIAAAQFNGTTGVSDTIDGVVSLVSLTGVSSFANFDTSDFLIQA